MMYRRGARDKRERLRDGGEPFEGGGGVRKRNQEMKFETMFGVVSALAIGKEAEVGWVGLLFYELALLWGWVETSSATTPTRPVMRGMGSEGKKWNLFTSPFGPICRAPTRWGTVETVQLNDSTKSRLMYSPSTPFIAIHHQPTTGAGTGSTMRVESDKNSHLQ